MISNVHLTDRDSTFDIERTLRFFRARKVDGVINCGDLLDWGLLSGPKYVAETWEMVFSNGKGCQRLSAGYCRFWISVQWFHDELAPKLKARIFYF